MPLGVGDIRNIAKEVLSKELIERDHVLVLEGATDYCYSPAPEAEKHIFLKFHPKTRELIIHDGQCAKVYADGELIYAYQLFDQFKPGGVKYAGDTWGAITATPEEVFFGGWAEADIDAIGRTRIWVYKYSHIHRIASDGRTVSLVWYDGPGTTTGYRPEVTDMLYSPKDDAIYFTRGDGGTDIWKLDLNTMQVSQVTNTGKSLLKMELLGDLIVAGGPDGYGSGGHIVIYDLLTDNVQTITSANGIFASSTLAYMNGQVIQYMDRFWIFGTGTAVMYRQQSGSTAQATFFRFNKALKVVGRRSQKVYIGGTPIVAVNPRDTNDEPRMPAGLLLRFDTPMPQIVMPTGYVSGLETDGKYLYIASAPQNHYYTVDYEPGRGSIFAVPVGEIFQKPLAPVEFQDEVNNWTAGDYYLGVPISGFSKRVLKVRAPTAFTLNLGFYYLWPATTDNFGESVNVNLSAGMNTIDLSSYDGIVAIAPTSNVSGLTYIKLILEP